METVCPGFLRGEPGLEDVGVIVILGNPDPGIAEIGVPVKVEPVHPMWF